MVVDTSVLYFYVPFITAFSVYCLRQRTQNVCHQSVPLTYFCSSITYGYFSMGMLRLGLKPKIFGLILEAHSLGLGLAVQGLGLNLATQGLGIELET